MMEKYDLVVAGTGPASSPAAEKCREAGWRVAVTDVREFGGTCALRGCNPKKVLAHAAELADWVRRMNGTYIHCDDLNFNWRRLIEFKREFTKPVTPGTEKGYQAQGIEMLHGGVQFTGPNRLRINGQEIESRHIYLVTGARPLKLGIPGEDYAITSEDFLELDSLPKHVTFIGGGYIAMEFAHAAARAGARVEVLEAGPRPLAGFDADLVDRLAEHSRNIGIEIHTQTEVKAIEPIGDGHRSVIVDHRGSKEKFETELVVLAAGREPNLADLNLEAGGLESTRHGLVVNEFLQSPTNSAVYAAGDCAATGQPQLTPVANEEGRAVAASLLGEPTRPDYGAVPAAVFSVPSLAAVGLREDQAREQGLEFEVNSGDWAEFNSLRKVGETCGAYKTLIDRTSNRILGAHLLGPSAGDIINFFALAMKYNLTASELKSVLYVFPTFAHDIRSMV